MFLGVISLLSEWPGLPGRKGSGRGWKSWDLSVLGGLLGSDAFGKQKEKTTLIQFTSSGCLVEPWDGKKETALGGEEAEDPGLGQSWLHEGNLYQGAESACAAHIGRGWSCLVKGMETDKKPVRVGGDMAPLVCNTEVPYHLCSCPVDEGAQLEPGV